jgi:hypothetical protein
MQSLQEETEAVKVGADATTTHAEENGFADSHGFGSAEPGAGSHEARPRFLRRNGSSTEAEAAGQERSRLVVHPHPFSFDSCWSGPDDPSDEVSPRASRQGASKGWD